MKRASMLAVIALAFATVAGASPPTPLPWTTSRFSVSTELGLIEFTMECPEGALTRLSAALGQRTANLPIERLAELSPSHECSGVTTRASREDEGTGKLLATELMVELSHGYAVERLQITFDVHSFEFTKAMRLLTYPGEPTQVTRVELQ